MIKNTIAFIILILTYLFPFRWAYLEYPDPIRVNGILKDVHFPKSLLFHFLTVLGFLAFFILRTTDGQKDSK